MQLLAKAADNGKIAFNPGKNRLFGVYSGCSDTSNPGKTAISDSPCHQLAMIDPDLAKIMAVWGVLSPEIRSVILRVAESEGEK